MGHWYNTTFMGLTTGSGEGGAGSYPSYTAKVLSYGPIAYWPLGEAVGGVANCQVDPLQDGAYTGVTLGQPGIGDGNTAPFFDGANDYVDIYTATIDAIWPYDEGSYTGWAKVFNVGVWTDAAERIFLNGANALGGAAYMCRFGKHGNANQLSYFRDDGANNEVAENVAGFSSVDWMHFALTWSVTSGNMMAYINGVQIGATQPGVLAHVGGDINANLTAIGVINTVGPASAWHGYLAHVGIWASALDGPTITALAVAAV